MYRLIREGRNFFAVITFFLRISSLFLRECIFCFQTWKCIRKVTYSVFLSTVKRSEPSLRSCPWWAIDLDRGRSIRRGVDHPIDSRRPSWEILADFSRVVEVAVVESLDARLAPIANPVERRQRRPRRCRPACSLWGRGRRRCWAADSSRPNGRRRWDCPWPWEIFSPRPMKTAPRTKGREASARTKKLCGLFSEDGLF